MKKFLRNKPKAVLVCLTVMLLLVVSLAGATGLAEVEVSKLRIVLDGGLRDSEGNWHMKLEGTSSLRIVCSGMNKFDSISAELALPDGSILTCSSNNPSLKLTVNGISAGTCTLRVYAWCGDTMTGSGTVTLILEGASGGTDDQETPEDAGDQEDENPDDSGQTDEDGPQGGGRRPSGGGRRGGNAGGKANANTVTPGKALTSTHSKGSGYVLPYGTVKLAVGTEAMKVLEIGGEELNLSCGGQLFKGIINGETLVLTRIENVEETNAEEAGWTVTQKALKTLSDSGISEVRLIDSGEEVTLKTDLEFSGNAYTKERAQGFVSADFLICRNDGNWSVRVEDREYDLTELTAE